MYCVVCRGGIDSCWLCVDWNRIEQNPFGCHSIVLIVIAFVVSAFSSYFLFDFDLIFCFLTERIPLSFCHFDPVWTLLLSLCRYFISKNKKTQTFRSIAVSLFGFRSIDLEYGVDTHTHTHNAVAYLKRVTQEWVYAVVVIVIEHNGVWRFILFIYFSII